MSHFCCSRLASSSGLARRRFPSLASCFKLTRRGSFFVVASAACFWLGDTLASAGLRPRVVEALLTQQATKQQRSMSYVERSLDQATEGKRRRANSKEDA
tara:strand:- start:632 stop:931 length:300 start_codon:yes stop_codon:yes gene_type:complete